jgi:F-box-like
MASSLPYELLENIFSNLDSKCLIKSCRGVCRTWKDLIDDEVLMRRALITPELRQTFRDRNFSFRTYYEIEQTYGRNLLKNIQFACKEQSVMVSFLSSLLPTSSAETGINKQQKLFESTHNAVCDHKMFQWMLSTGRVGVHTSEKNRQSALTVPFQISCCSSTE